MEESGVVAALFRRWIAVVVSILVVAVAAVAFDSLQPERHRSTATFYVRESLTSSIGMLGVPQGPSSNDWDWRTLPAPLRSESLVEAALAEAGLEVEDLQEYIGDDVSVSSEDGSHVTTLKVTVRGSEDDADAMAFAMIEELDATLIETYRKDLSDRLAAVEAQLDPAWERVRRLPSEAGTGVELPVDGGTLAYDLLSQQHAELQVALAGTTSLVVVMDEPHSERVSPDPMRSGLVGVAAGTLAGLGVALLLDAFDRRRARAAV